MRSHLIHGTLAAVLLIVSVGCTGAPPAVPTAVPATTPTAAVAAAVQAVPTATLPVPSATPESLKPTPPAEATSAIPSPTPAGAAGSGFGSLKPATSPTVEKPVGIPTAKPTVPAKPGSDSLKPTEPTATPSQTQPTKPATPAGKMRPVTGLKVEPTPVAARKGVANDSVDPVKYLTEMVTDLQQLADAMSELGNLADAYDAGNIGDQEVIAGFQTQSGIVRNLYQREVQRDYPTSLKEVDDYYVESMRSASKVVDIFVVMLQTGDEKYLGDIQKEMERFQFFISELEKRLA